MSDVSDNTVYERADALVVIVTSALSFEPLCKLNDSNSQKDLQHIDFALLCLMIALLCATFHIATNQWCQPLCYIDTDNATQDFTLTAIFRRTIIRQRWNNRYDRHRLSEGKLSFSTRYNDDTALLFPVVISAVSPNIIVMFSRT